MSIATGLGTGQPLEHALRTAIFPVHLGELAGLAPPELVDAYYISLLHSFGCTSDAPEQTARSHEGGGPGQIARGARGDGRPRPRERARDRAPTLALHCEVAQRFARWLGFGASVISNLMYVFERWDGNGFSGVAAAEGIALPARVLNVAREVSVFVSAAGRDAAREVIEQRAGGAYDPHLASLATHPLRRTPRRLDDALIWQQAMAAKPPPSDG